MAKKAKSHRKKGSRTGGRMGTIIKLGSIAAGYLAADKINEQVDKIVPKSKDATGKDIPNETVAIAGELGLGGLLLLKRMPGGKTIQTVATVAGGLLVGAGLKRSLKKLGVITGYQSYPVIGSHRMAGYQNVPVVGAMGVPSALSGGVPSALSGGYRSQGSGINGYRSQGSGVMAGVGGDGGLMRRD